MERIILLSITILLFAAITKAQITKGSVLLGGGVGFSSNKVEQSANESQSKSVSIFPAVGIAVQQNLVVGLNLRYASTKNKIDIIPGSTGKANSYTAGFFARKYLQFAKAFYFFAEPGVYYSTSKSVSDVSPLAEAKGWNTGINFYPGLAYKITNKIHLEAGLPSFFNLEYSTSKYTDTNTPTTTGQNFRAGLSAGSLANLAVGFRIFLANK